MGGRKAINRRRQAFVFIQVYYLASVSNEYWRFQSLLFAGPWAEARQSKDEGKHLFSLCQVYLTSVAIEIGRFQSFLFAGSWAEERQSIEGMREFWPFIAHTVIRLRCVSCSGRSGCASDQTLFEMQRQTCLQVQGFWQGRLPSRFVQLTVRLLFSCWPPHAGTNATPCWDSVWELSHFHSAWATGAAFECHPGRALDLTCAWSCFGYLECFSLYPQVSPSRKGGKKRNGAIIWVGKKKIRSWSCIRSELTMEPIVAVICRLACCHERLCNVSWSNFLVLRAWFLRLLWSQSSHHQVRDQHPREHCLDPTSLVDLVLKLQFQCVRSPRTYRTRFGVGTSTKQRSRIMVSPLDSFWVQAQPSGLAVRFTCLKFVDWIPRHH